MVKGKRIYANLGKPKARNRQFPTDSHYAPSLHEMDWIPEKVRREWKEAVDNGSDVLVATGSREFKRNPYKRKTLAERMASGCKSNSPYHMRVNGERWLKLPENYLKKGPIKKADGRLICRTEQHWIEYQRRLVTRYNNKWAPMKWSLRVDRREVGGVLVTGVVLRRIA